MGTAARLAVPTAAPSPGQPGTAGTAGQAEPGAERLSEGQGVITPAGYKKGGY